MKIRGKFKGISPLLPLYILVGALAVTVPLRTYQLLFITEYDTGFYKTVDWSVYVIYGITALTVILSYILVNLAKNVPSSTAIPSRKNLFMAIASILFAFGIIFDVIMAWTTMVMGNTGDSLSTISMQENFVPLIIEAVSGIFAAIYIMIFGISYIDGRTTFSQYKFLALTPLVWSICRIIIRFLKKISYVNIADLMLELFAIAFMMIFLLAFARISSGLANEKSMRTIFSSGFASVFFCALANIPRLVVTLTGNSAYLPDEYPLSFCDITFALFATVYIVNALKYARENDHAELYDESENKKN